LLEEQLRLLPCHLPARRAYNVYSFHKLSFLAENLPRAMSVFNLRAGVDLSFFQIHGIRWVVEK
jgi:hypothetical protein